MSYKANILVCASLCSKNSRIIFLPKLITPDKPVGPNQVTADQQYTFKFTTVNFRDFLPINQSSFHRSTTVVGTYLGRTKPQTPFGRQCGTVCTSARGDHRFGTHRPRQEHLLARAPSLLGVSASTGLYTVFPALSS